jgi:aspartate racemase
VKIIGLIGGMSWNSSMEYYRVINTLVAEKMGGLHSARVILYSLDFEEVEQAQRQGRWEDALTSLTHAGRALKDAGADFLVLCTNTMHKVADRLEEEVGLPLLNIADTACIVITECGLETVGLLGTRYTMEESFYVDRIKERYNIKVIVPTAEQRAAIDSIIYNELCQGIFKPSSRRTCLKIIDALRARGAQGVILGCTELPLLIRPGDTGIPLFDTTHIHAEAAVNLALA